MAVGIVALIIMTIIACNYFKNIKKSNSLEDENDSSNDLLSESDSKEK